MMINTRPIRIVFFITILLNILCGSLHADRAISKKITAVQNAKNINLQKKKSIDAYLLPENHPLHQQLGNLLKNPKMFKSPLAFEQAQFKITKGHRGLMVGSHPAISQYLIKKFPNTLSQEDQLKNFILRIESANKIRKYINKHNLKHIVVPQKWLYKLPSNFSKAIREEYSYILIVEKMDIFDGSNNPTGENGKRYYNMDKEILKELCMVLHDLKGCDAWPRNQPFTRDGKIAFLDTEHLGKRKGDFVTHIVPRLNEDLKKYAMSIWKKLEKGESLD